MVQPLVALVVAPLLTAAATLAARRWGPRTGGVVSAFPAIVGPVLIILALQHGRGFAARAAAGTLLGLVALAAFAVTYGRLAQGHRWSTCLAGGWLAAAATSLATGVLAGRASAPVCLLVAAGSLALAHRAMPRAAATTRALGRRPGIPARMALTALLVTVLAAAAGAAGPLAGGMLAALPVLASILAVLTHRDAGAPAAVALLRGMLAGMAGFVAFCEVVALLLARQPAVVAFGVATAAAVAVQLAVARGRVPPQRHTPAPR